MTRLGEKRASTRTTQRTGDSLEAETEQSEKDELEQTRSSWSRIL